MRTFSLVMAILCAASISSIAEEHQPGKKPTIVEKKGHTYRVFHKGSYEILDTAGFYLYSHEQLLQGMKIARPATVYYFSLTLDGTPQPLTVLNLEKVFANYPSFCYRLRTDFHSEKDLTTWLPTLKTYKIKYAYAQSAK